MAVITKGEMLHKPATFIASTTLCYFYNTTAQGRFKAMVGPGQSMTAGPPRLTFLNKRPYNLIQVQNLFTLTKLKRIGKDEKYNLKTIFV
jgi:hypothetical protein